MKQLTRYAQQIIRTGQDNHTRPTVLVQVQVQGLVNH